MAENYEEVLAPTIYFDKNFQIQAAKPRANITQPRAICYW